MTNPLTTYDPPLAGPPTLPTTDISFTTEDTEVGRLLVAAAPDGTLLTCAYAGDTAAEDSWLQRLSDTVSPRILRHPAPTDDARRALTAYLCGASRSLDVRTDLALTTPFQRRVLLGLASRVGYGERTTYGALARAVEHPGAARAVGTALGANPLCIVLPCHRVLPASGGIGGYAGGPAAKAHLLALEAGALGG